MPGGDQATMRTAGAMEVCAGVARNPVTFPRGGSGFRGGDWAGADFPVGGKK